MMTFIMVGWESSAGRQLLTGGVIGTDILVFDQG